MDEELWEYVKTECKDVDGLIKFLSEGMDRMSLPAPKPVNENWDIRGCANYLISLEHNLVLARICERPGLSSKAYLDKAHLAGWTWMDGDTPRFAKTWKDVPMEYRNLEGLVNTCFAKQEGFNTSFPDTKLPATTAGSSSILQTLEEYGLIIRKPFKSCKLVYPTEKGKSVAEHWLSWYRLVDNIVYNTESTDRNFWDKRKKVYSAPAGTIIGGWC